MGVRYVFSVHVYALWIADLSGLASSRCPGVVIFCLIFVCCYCLAVVMACVHCWSKLVIGCRYVLMLFDAPMISDTDLVASTFNVALAIPNFRFLTIFLGASGPGYEQQKYG